MFTKFQKQLILSLLFYIGFSLFMALFLAFVLVK